MDNNQAARRKKGVAFQLFEYVYLLRHNRLPEEWEWEVAWALLSCGLQMVRPPEAGWLRDVDAAVETVDLALGVAEAVS